VVCIKRVLGTFPTQNSASENLCRLRISRLSKNQKISFVEMTYNPPQNALQTCKRKIALHTTEAVTFVKIGYFLYIYIVQDHLYMVVPQL